MQQTLSSAFSGFWHGIVADDPGSIRLRFAVRLTGAVALTTLALMALYRLAPLPIGVMVPGLIVALFASIAVRDLTVREQKTTIFLMPVSAFVSYGLGALLAPWPHLTQAIFLTIVFAAVYARRFGPRATALGAVGYIAFLIGAYLHPAPSQMGWIALPLAIGTASVLLWRFVWLNDAPEAAVRRIVRALDLRIADMLDDVAIALREATAQQHPHRLRRHIERLNEAALLADEKLDSIIDADESLRLAVNAFRQQLLVTELAAERVPVTVPRLALDPAESKRLAREMLVLEARFRSRAAAVILEEIDPAAVAALSVHDQLLRELAAARVQIRPHLDREGNVRHRRMAETFRWSPAVTGSAAQGWFGASFRQAVQVTVACGLAMLGGALLSPDRWFWAVIAAYTAFMGITSRGDSLLKIGGRMVGTAFGLIAGLVLGVIVGGEHMLAMGFIFLSLFLGFYFFYSSYAVAVFWITTYGSLLYALIGTFSGELLWLRLEETLVGSAAAAFAALAIFPQRTHEAFRAGITDFLERLSHALDDVFAVMDGKVSSAQVRDSIRQLDRRFQALRETARPLTAWRRAGAAEETIRLLRGLNYWVRELIASAPQADPGRLGITAGELKAMIAKVESRLRETLPDHERSAEITPPPAPAATVEALSPADRALANIRRLLVSLLDHLGKARA